MEHLKTNLEKLKIGSILRSYQKENSEPENIAIGQISKELRYLQRQYEYISEVERVLKELRLTTQLIAEIRGKELSGTIKISKQELLAYYQGFFLTLVHQMKDKVMQLIHLMTEKTVPENPGKENDISITNLFWKKESILKEMGIEDYIKQWDQENLSSKIAVVLRKRTHHHHRVSGLKYDNDFLNLGFADMAAQAQIQEILSDLGKQQIEKMRTESTNRLFSGAEAKTKETLPAVEENVEKISLALINYAKLPISEEEAKKIVDENSKMLTSFGIINKASFEKIPEVYKGLFTNLTKEFNDKCKIFIESIYLVGSLGRGEYEEGYSDINIYIVFSEDGAVKKTIEEIINFVPFNKKLDIKTFKISDFLSEKCLKYRFIVKADGLLIYGKDLINSEKIPKAGLLTALMLNDDILNNLDEAEKWMNENPTASVLEISKKSRKLSKQILDFIYGIVMSNKPQYTSSRIERIAKINEMYPENKDMIETLINVSRHGVGEFKSFSVLTGFRSQAKLNLDQMLAVKNKISSSAAEKRKQRKTKTD